MPLTVQINPHDPASVAAALNTEWLLTNGLGGYAMGSALGVNARRYHGLLVAATRPPVGRVVALHSLIEQLIIPRDDGTEEVIDLSTQQFVGPDPNGEPMLHPGGWRVLAEFRCKQPRHAAWTWRIGAIVAHRHVRLARGENSLRVRYQFSGLPQRAAFRVRPLIALRDFHSLITHEHGEFRCEVSPPYRIWIHRDARLVLRAGAAWNDDAQWWHNLHYQRDRERGQDFVEHVYSPGYVQIDAAQRYQPPLPALELRFGDGGDAAAMTDSRPQGDADAQPAHALRAVADQFVVKRRAADRWFSSVIAGYPWFGDWGRDTMISLPGLMLCSGRLEEASSTLLGYARRLHNGLIPNLFDDSGDGAHYNTVDASLWFVHAAHAWWRAASTGDGREKPDAPANDRVAEILSACRTIIAAYRRGTDFNIHMDDSDGLIIAGDENTQLTWMDARRDGITFTPRCGKPVEINALWHNALLCLAQMTDDAGERNDLLMLARRAAAAFRAAFWWDGRQCLHDCLAPGGDAASRQRPFVPDGQLRPNQILAVSLPFSPLNEAQQRAVAKIVGERLLTPFGLRTLDRDDLNYKPRFEGNLFERDAAYHNGTVWPWLIGPYCEALLRVERFSKEVKQRVGQIIQPLMDEMNNTSGGRCLGQIAEVYDGDPPHRPSGCPAQAWSVAEVLRIASISG